MRQPELKTLTAEELAAIAGGLDDWELYAIGFNGDRIPASVYSGGGNYDWDWNPSGWW
jgi:bacteriocin-like protein